jgi:hypothetical protein
MCKKSPKISFKKQPKGLRFCRQCELILQPSVFNDLRGCAALTGDRRHLEPGSQFLANTLPGAGDAQQRSNGKAERKGLRKNL